MPAPRPPKEDQQTQEEIETQEIRAAVCREHRRGLTNKSIAGGLGISIYRVQKILDEDQTFIQNLPPKSYNTIFGPPTGDTEQEEKKIDLKRQLREQQARMREEQRQNSLPPNPPTNHNGSSPSLKPEITVYKARPYSPPHSYQQQAEAFKLRKEGKTYQEIADRIGSSPQDAQKMVRNQLSSLSLDEYQDRELARRMQLERLDALMAAVWPSATRTPTEDYPDLGPDLEASRTALRILERQSKLLGLDSPAKIDISDRVRIIAERNGVDYEEMMDYVKESTRLKLAPTS